MNNLRAEYVALKRLENNPDFAVLQGKWLYLVSEIQKSRDNAASRGQESAWRYFAGQEKGAQRIILALAAAIADLEAQDKELVDESKYDTLLEEIRGSKS